MADKEQPRAPKPIPTRQSVAAAAPWLPVPYEIADMTAIQALQRGDAGPEQQRRALAWIVNQAAGTYDMHFRPGSMDGARETDFALGRAFVGQQIVKMCNTNASALRRREPNADAPDPTA